MKNNNFNIELVLDNPQRNRNKIKFFPDESNRDLIGFTIEDKGELISTCKEEIDGNSQEFFHLDKFQVNCLINFLKLIYEDME